MTGKRELYDGVLVQLKALLVGEGDGLAGAANTAALVYHSLPEINWAGFYFLRGGQLVLGPFQGRPACTRIAMGKGVCGTAAAERKTLSCQTSMSFPAILPATVPRCREIVVPIMADGRLMGVLDLDSPRVGRFDADDREGSDESWGLSRRDR